MAEQEEHRKRKNPDLRRDFEEQLPEVKRPPGHVPSPSATPAEQVEEHERRNPKGEWTGPVEDHWTRAAAPIGSRELLMDAVAEAVLAEFGSTPEAGLGAVDHSWMKTRLDAYDFPTLDQDIRRHVREAFEERGIKVQGLD